MKIHIICVGKLKESYLTAAMDEYMKRLSRYATVTVTEVKDEQTKQNASVKDEVQVKQIEGERILSVVQDGYDLFLCDVGGKTYTSEQFAEHIERQKDFGTGKIALVIGGSLGLSEEVYKRGKARVSFSSMTFPHQLFRVMCVEQLYRAFRIMNNEPYHK